MSDEEKDIIYNPAYLDYEHKADRIASINEYNSQKAKNFRRTEKRLKPNYEAFNKLREAHWNCVMKSNNTKKVYKLSNCIRNTHKNGYVNVWIDHNSLKWKVSYKCSKGVTFNLENLKEATFELGDEQSLTVYISEVLDLKGEIFQTNDGNYHILDSIITGPNNEIFAKTTEGQIQKLKLCWFVSNETMFTNYVRRFSNKDNKEQIADKNHIEYLLTFNEPHWSVETLVGSESGSHIFYKPTDTFRTSDTLVTLISKNSSKKWRVVDNQKGNIEYFDLGQEQLIARLLVKKLSLIGELFQSNDDKIRRVHRVYLIESETELVTKPTTVLVDEHGCRYPLKEVRFVDHCRFLTTDSQ